MKGKGYTEVPEFASGASTQLSVQTILLLSRVFGPQHVQRYFFKHHSGLGRTYLLKVGQEHNLALPWPVSASKAIIYICVRDHLQASMVHTGRETYGTGICNRDCRRERQWQGVWFDDRPRQNGLRLTSSLQTHVARQIVKALGHIPSVVILSQVPSIHILSFRCLTILVSKTSSKG